MATSKNIIKSWFLTNLFPTESQFASTWDSFWHKDEAISQDSIENLQQSLDAKLDVEAYVTRPTTIYNGKVVYFIKHPDNNNPVNQNVFEDFDFVENLVWDNALIINMGQYLGGDKSDINNLDQLSYTRIEPIN